MRRRKASEKSPDMQTATARELVHVQLCLRGVCTKLGDSDVLSDRGGLAMFTLCFSWIVAMVWRHPALKATWWVLRRFQWASMGKRPVGLP